MFMVTYYGKKIENHRRDGRRVTHYGSFTAAATASRRRALRTDENATASAMMIPRGGGTEENKFKNRIEDDVKSLRVPSLLIN